MANTGRYEITTTQDELAQDNAFAALLLLDGLRAQVELDKLGRQQEKLGKNRQDFLAARTKAERARQADDRRTLQHLARKYGRQIIITDTMTEIAWGSDHGLGTYGDVDFENGILDVETPSGTEAVVYAEAQRHPDLGLDYRLAAQLTFPARIELTADELRRYRSDLELG